MNRNPRALILLVFLLAVGLVAASYVIWTLMGRVTQQQQQVEAGKAAQAQEQRFAQALADQVRRLGGTPTPLPATQRTLPTGTTVTVTVVQPTPGAASPAPSSRSSTRPRPSVSPNSTRSPSPSPSPIVCVGPICYPGGTR
jgi:hypothetical protein